MTGLNNGTSPMELVRILLLLGYNGMAPTELTKGPHWPEKVSNQLSSQSTMAGLAGKWPDLSKSSFLFAVLGNGSANTHQNGSFRYCRIAVFNHKSLLPVFSILSLIKRFFIHFSSQGHSIGHFVFYNSLSSKR